MMKLVRQWVAVVVTFLAPLSSLAQQPPVTVVNVIELTGAGSIAGTNFKNGLALAFKEINAAGGILGRKVEVTILDTQSNPETAKAMMRKAVEMKPYAVMGPNFSGMVLASMKETQSAEIPNFIGGEAADITLQGNPYVFRTSFTQAEAMPRVARYIKTGVRANSVAVVWINNEFGKGGHDAILKALQAEGIKVAADISTEPQQADFLAAVLKVKQSNADAAFVYLTEEESARFLRELQRQGYDKWIVGESTLLGQQVIELAGEAANGVRGHVGLTAHALAPTIRAFDKKFLKEYKYRSDHNGMKGYTAAYVLKAVTEKIGKFDSKEFAQAMKGVALSAKDHPGILLDVKYDDKGDLDRASFIVRVAQGKHEFIAQLPPAAGGPAPAEAPKRAKK
jgi:branched-chain amino acid transport system substrate-binding protein